MIEKMLYLKTITEPVIVRTLVMIKKGTDKHIMKTLGSGNQFEIQKKCTLRNCLSPKETIAQVNKILDAQK